MSSLLQLQYPQYVVLCQPVPYVNFRLQEVEDMKLGNPALLESLREEIVTSLSATSNLPTDKHPLKECPFCSTFATRDLLNEHKQSNHTEKNGRKQTKGKKSVATKTKSKKPPTKTECALLTFLGAIFS